MPIPVIFINNLLFLFVMAITHTRPHRKPSGGKYKPIAKKKKDFGNIPTLPNIAKRVFRPARTIGGNIKNRILSAEMINVTDPKTKKAVQAKMLNVVENTASSYYVRRNALTKGAVVNTDKGKVKITSRPAQDGCVNGVLVE